MRPRRHRRNTFSDSALYDYESVTYRAVFGAYSI